MPAGAAPENKEEKMKKFVMEKDFLEIFPDAKIGILVCRGIDNHIREANRYAVYLTA